MTPTDTGVPDITFVDLTFYVRAGGDRDQIVHDEAETAGVRLDHSCHNGTVVQSHGADEFILELRFSLQPCIRH